MYDMYVYVYKCTALFLRHVAYETVPIRGSLKAGRTLLIVTNPMCGSIYIAIIKGL